MTMTPLLRGAVVLCTLPLAPCMTTALAQQWQINETSPLDARAAATPSRPAEAFKAWTFRVARHIASKKRYPAAASARREQGTVVVTFVLDRQGRLSGNRVLRTSGFATLDSAALELVRQAQPFPAPPSGSAAPRFNMVINIRYELTPPLPRCTFLNRLFQPCVSQ